MNIPFGSKALLEGVLFVAAVFVGLCIIELIVVVFG